GFWAKYLVVKPSLDAGSWYLATTALVVGVLTLYSMLKIWNEAFWKSPKTPAPMQGSAGSFAAQYVAIAALSAITLCIGLNPEPFVAFSIEAAGQLTDNSRYINAVLEGSYARS